ncbi:hypothetical protein TWF696_004665 [Orbilia brochopaga]|uniref:MARVEL domain-containing protein n=1 Tax=Orbilia brochopaga TaxID=3140254 RepID=A0AAV9V9K6_9PEZI
MRKAAAKVYCFIPQLAHDRSRGTPIDVGQHLNKPYREYFISQSSLAKAAAAESSVAPSPVSSLRTRTMPSTVWPVIPFLALRGAQIFFGIVVLGLSAYIGDKFDDRWSPWFALVTALLTLIADSFLIATFFIAPAFTAPLITLGIDAFLFLFWIISLGGFADQASFVLDLSSCYGDNLCGSIKGNMAMIVFEFLLFLATLVWSGWWFYRERSGQTTTANPEGGHVASAGAIAGAPPTGSYPMQQQAPAPVASPAPYPQESQYQPYPGPQSPPPQSYTQSPPPQQYPEMPIPGGQQGYYPGQHQGHSQQ